MELTSEKKLNWKACTQCHGLGKMMMRPTPKKLRLFRDRLSNYEASGGKGFAPKPPVEGKGACLHCGGSGLVACKHAVQADSIKYPTIAIIGGGIGGAALAVACQHRGIPFTLYERDASFDARSQGYGLTLQQAIKAIEGLGIFSLNGRVASTKHVVHTSDGTVIGEWGYRRWKKSFVEKTTKRKNVHIARQTLRASLLEELGVSDAVKWGHALTGLSNSNPGPTKLTFQVEGRGAIAHADLVVGADGIHSMVRKLTTGEGKESLQYLGCIVILGICPLKSLDDISSELLDSSTTFQTVNGHERIYVMPYDADSIMWQLSFPLSEAEAKELSTKGPAAMKREACRRLLNWHSPVPQILAATTASRITGYPAYDRKLFDPQSLREAGNVTLIGDAAHPMSPFKAQGANQALLDALTLARRISAACDSNPQWREVGIRELVLNGFEEEMAQRSASKVEDSAKAARLLHSKEVLQEGDGPRGRE